MLGQRIADRNERRGLGQPIDLGDLPAKLTLEPLDGGRRRWRTCGRDVHAARNIVAEIGGGVSETDQHRWGRAEPGHALPPDQPEDLSRVGPRETYVGG